MSHTILMQATTILLLLLLSPPPLISAEPVLDVDGNELMIGSKYYVLPVYGGKNYGKGGLNFGSIQDYYDRCPHFSVIQNPDDRCGSDYGLPVVFSPPDGTQKSVETGTDFKISFNVRPPRVPPYCEWPTTDWTMVSRGETNTDVGAELGMFHHGGLGRNNNDDDDDVSSLFKIVKNKAYGYRLRYCPGDSSKSGLKDVVCGDLAPVYDRRLRMYRLSLVDDSVPPFQLMFIKAK